MGTFTHKTEREGFCDYDDKKFLLQKRIAHIFVSSELRLKLLVIEMFIHMRREKGRTPMTTQLMVSTYKE